MLESQDKEKLLQKIVKKTTKSKEEVMKLVEEKKGKFAGLLTDNGALYMLAKEFEIDLEIEKTIGEKIKISQLETGMQNLELTVKIMHIFSPKKYEKNGKKGTYCKLLVADETGEIKLTLWHGDAQKLQEEQVQRNDLILLENCFVTEFNGIKQLSMGKGSILKTNPPYIEKKEIPESKVQTKKLKELTTEETEVDLIAKIIRIFPKKEFEKQGEKRKVMNFEIADNTLSIRATAWNDIVELINKTTPEEIIKIEGAYTKQGMNSLEVHLGWKSRIIKNFKTKEEFPTVTEILTKQQSEENQQKQISKLQENDKFIQLNATISDINKSNFYFEVCPNCQKKANKIDTKYKCEKCGEIQIVEKIAVISVQLKDSTGEIRAISFAEPALQLMELSKEELKEKLEKENAEELMDEFKTRLTTKNIKVSGYVKKNTLNEELEFVIKQAEYVKIS